VDEDSQKEKRVMRICSGRAPRNMTEMVW
jgi:hypothetical protein